MVAQTEILPHRRNTEIKTPLNKKCEILSRNSSTKVLKAQKRIVESKPMFGSSRSPTGRMDYNFKTPIKTKSKVEVVVKEPVT